MPAPIPASVADPGAVGPSTPRSTSEWEAAYRHPVPRSFYDRPTVRVARDLLGCYLVRPPGPGGEEGWRAGRVVETEAYVANDPANHAARGMTERNRSMFLGPGHVYVYRIHQVHCANLTTAEGQAVLLRAVEPATDLPSPPRGPGRLCRAFGLDRSHDGLDAIEGEVRVLPRVTPPRRIVAAPRIGIRLAADRPLRFLEEGSAWVSKRPPEKGKQNGRR